MIKTCSLTVSHHLHQRIIRIRHRLHRRMRHRIKNVMLKLIVRANIDVGPFIPRGVDIIRGGEDYMVRFVSMASYPISFRGFWEEGERERVPVMHFPPCSTSYPPMRTSWLRMIASRPFFSQNLAVMSGPNWRPTPRLLGLRPGSCWGSVQSISIMLFRY